jgi:hypothetical protein
MNDGYKACAGIHHSDHVSDVKAAIGSTGNNAQTDSPLFQASQWSHHRVMFYGAGDNMITGF